jgi:hypothetical protein
MSTDTNENTPEIGSEEYNAQMVQKADDLNSAANPENVAQKPEEVPDKFWDAENGVVNYKAWADSTKELEAKFTEQSQAEKMNEEGSEFQEIDEVDTSQVSEGDFDKYSQEFLENGELSEATYEALEAKGVPRNYVDAYIAGQQALAKSSRMSILNEAGFSDEATFNKAVEWAKVNMDRTQLDLYNQAVESGDSTQLNTALSTLATSFKEAKGTTTSSLINTGTPSAASSGYDSREQMVAAMSDPRYKQDPAYRKQVETKVGLSKFL